jgi:exonuclease III
VVVMKIISWNVRGLGGFEKKREVSRLVREKNPFILCLQESKLSAVNNMVRNAIWNDDNVDFSFQPSIGASGGLVTLWNCNEVEVWSSFNMDYVLGIQGKFLKSGEKFTLLNVYAPCDSFRQLNLWHSISARMMTLGDVNVCVCGDFNAVRNSDERRSVGSALII